MINNMHPFFHLILCLAPIMGKHRVTCQQLDPSFNLANRLEWYLQDVVFDDGTFATGSFEYNAEDVFYSNISISTQILKQYEAMSPRDFGNSTFFSAVPSLLFLDPSIDFEGQQQYLAFEFESALTSGGGSVRIKTGGSSFEGRCETTLCQVVSKDRAIISGYVTTIAPTSQSPSQAPSSSSLPTRSPTLQPSSSPSLQPSSTPSTSGAPSTSPTPEPIVLVVEYTFEDPANRTKNTGNGDPDLDGVLFPEDQNDIEFVVGAGYDQSAAAKFTGAGCIEIPISPEINGSPETPVGDRTIELEFSWDGTDSTDYQVLFEEGGGLNGMNMYLGAFANDNAVLFMVVWTEVNDEVMISAVNTTDIEAGKWYLATLVLDHENTILVGYLDGVQFGEESLMDFMGINDHLSENCLGGIVQNTLIIESNVRPPREGFYFHGLIDNFKLYNSVELPVVRTALPSEAPVPSPVPSDSPTTLQPTLFPSQSSAPTTTPTGSSMQPTPQPTQEPACQEQLDDLTKCVIDILGFGSLDGDVQIPDECKTKEDEYIECFLMTPAVSCPCFSSTDLDSQVQVLEDPLCRRIPGFGFSLDGFRQDNYEYFWGAVAGLEDIVTGEPFCIFFDEYYNVFINSTDLSEEEVQACKDILSESEMFAENNCTLVQPCPCFNASQIDTQVEALQNATCEVERIFAALNGTRAVSNTSWSAYASLEVNFYPRNECRFADPQNGLFEERNDISDAEASSCVSILLESAMFAESSCVDTGNTPVPISPTVSPPPIPDPTPAPTTPAPTTETPPAPLPTPQCHVKKCCEAECCEGESKWSRTKGCHYDPSSSEWDTVPDTPSPDPDDSTSCRLRICCDYDCCGRGTYYSSARESCIPY